MADLQIVLSGSDLEDAVALLKETVLDAARSVAPTQSRSATPAPRKSTDPLAIATLVLTVPSALLSVVDLADRIRKRRRAQAIIAAAKRLRFEQAVESQITAADGTPLALDGLDADALLELAGRVGAAAASSPLLPEVKRHELTRAGPFSTRAPRIFPLLEQAEYPVWYGTNRQPNDPTNPDAGYSAQRDTAVHYGRCRVYVPASHKIGSTGSPWWKRLLTMTDDRLRLLSTEGQSAAAFWQSVGTHVAAAPTTERSAVIFIHGYNVSFDDAALRTAQLGFDLSVRGAMAFFSWPSRGTLEGYLADGATIEASEDAIADFMVDFADHSGAQAVHIIAHSMGNRGVLRAVNRIAAQAQQRSSVRFGQVLLAAADVDVDVFCRLSAGYSQVAQRTTLYVSGRDRAIETSRWLHNFPRVGLLPPVLVAPPIETVNVTNADLTLLGHGYIADARDVLRDMHDLIMNDTAPERRFGLREERNETNERFWQIGA